MIKFLIKSTNEYRLESMEDVEQFHKDMQTKAAKEGYTLSSFAWTEKYEKEKGEIIATYYDVKLTFVFNDLKVPEFPEFNTVEYPDVITYQQGE